MQADVESVVGNSESAFTGVDELADRQGALISGLIANSIGLSLASLFGAPASSATPSPAGDTFSASAAAADRAGGGVRLSSDWASTLLGSFAAPPIASLVKVKQEHHPCVAEPASPAHTKQKRVKTEAPETPQSGKRLGSFGGAPANIQRGRPKQDRVAAADKMLENFKATTHESENFYGAGKATQLKAMQRLHDDLKAESENTGDAVLFEVMTLRMKRVSAALEVLKIYLKLGSEHPEFCIHDGYPAPFLEHVAERGPRLP